MTTTTIAHDGGLIEKLANAFQLAFDVMADASLGLSSAREAERLARLADQDPAKLG